MHVVFVEPPKHFWFTRARAEPQLEHRFGEAYRQYKRTTPFLLPRLPIPLHLKALTNLFRGQTAPSPRLTYILYTSVSILGVIFLILLTYSTSLPVVHLPHQEAIITVCFDVICLGGIVAAIYPSTCSQLFSRQKSRLPLPSHALRRQDGTTHIPRRGHHPDCQQYESHVLQLRDKSYCGGCLGLGTGAIFAVVGSIPLFLGLTPPHGEAWLWVGSGFLILGILQHQFSSTHNSGLHFLLNVLFVLGPFFQLVGLLTLNLTLVTELYLLILIIFWIVTRIILSQLQHASICQACTEPCTRRGH